MKVKILIDKGTEHTFQKKSITRKSGFKKKKIIKNKQHCKTNISLISLRVVFVIWLYDLKEQKYAL